MRLLGTVVGVEFEESLRYSFSPLSVFPVEVDSLSLLKEYSGLRGVVVTFR